MNVKQKLAGVNSRRKAVAAGRLYSLSSGQ